MKLTLGQRIRGGMTQTRTIAAGFFLIIVIGTILLMLPISVKDGQPVSFLDCLFTSTSATCVTGLVVADTWQHWTIFGQVVILLLIQTGGMGFMTVGVAFAIVLRRKISIRQRGILMSSMNIERMGGIVRLAKKVAAGVLVVEGVGALLLAVRFIPQFGFARGMYYSIFHSISAFCNAGIDLMGYEGAYSSLTSYADDWLVSLTICALIIVGGIGFFVWDDIMVNKWHVKKYRLHTKIVISSTAVLIIGGTFFIWLFERNGLMKGMPAGETFLTSLFCAVTARTAGFNTIDMTQLSAAGRLLTELLMFIGGSPGSTAGGIKTVTVVVLGVYVWSNLRGQGQCNIFRRRIDDESIKKASNVLCISLVLAVAAVITICAVQPGLSVSDIMFEVISALGTAGMSTGVTRQMCGMSRIIMIILMYCGRLGGMSFAMTFTESRKKVPVRLPSERLMIG